MIKPPVSAPLLGLDLGQAKDPAALIGADVTDLPGGRHYSVRFIHRWELGTRYTEVVEDLRGWTAKPQLAEAPVIIDQTGVGRPVVDMALALLTVPVIPVTITGGFTASEQPDGWHVPKKDLVGAVQIVLNQRRIEFAKTPLTATLVKELDDFKVKISKAGNETFGEWREGKHDDLVLALAILCWIGENTPYPTVDVLTLTPPADRGPVARAPKSVFMAPERQGADFGW